MKKRRNIKNIASVAVYKRKKINERKETIVKSNSHSIFFVKSTTFPTQKKLYNRINLDSSL